MGAPESLEKGNLTAEIERSETEQPPAADVPRKTLRDPDIRIGTLTEREQFARCVELQLEVWGYSEGDLIPKRVFIVASRIGGQVIGAFDGDTIIGFAMAFPGYKAGRPYLHSHMLAVLPEYRNAGLGRRLKLAQRDEALARGFDLMEWTFDPLEIKNAHLNIARLGAIARRYQPDFYGPSSSPLQGGLPTDRLYAEWWLRSPRVKRVLGEETNGESVETSPVERQIEVPGAVYEWKQDEGQRKLAESLQARVRTALQQAFAQGLAVTGYERNSGGDGCFVLTKDRANWEQ
jgi:predicted GNAT superfamily acetyltransferase